MRQVTRKGLMTVAAATGVLAVTGGYAYADSAAHGAAVDSPGVLSGNSVQAPVNVPVNVCGNTVNAVALLNPATGNTCVNQGGDSHTGDHHAGHRGSGHGEGLGNGGYGGGDQDAGYGSGGHGSTHQAGGHGDDGYGDVHQGGGYGGGDHHSGGSHASGYTEGSPGIGSGNDIQVPIDIPVNVCGNSVAVGGLGVGTDGNDCANTPDRTPPVHTAPPVKTVTPPKPGGGSAVHTTPATRTSLTRPAAPQLAHTGSEAPLGLLVPAGAAALLGGSLLYRRARAGMR